MGAGVAAFADPARHAAQLIAMFGMFIAGGLLGWGLSSWAAPGFGLGAAISGLLLPESFAAGLVMWAGLDIVTAVLDRGRGRRRDSSNSYLAARSAVWFVPVCLTSTCLGGFLVGILPGGEGPFASMLAYGAVGAAYGLASGGLRQKGICRLRTPGRCRSTVSNAEMLRASTDDPLRLGGIGQMSPLRRQILERESVR